MYMQSQDRAKERVTPDLAKEKKQLTVTLHIGDKQIDTLTTEQRERMANRLSQAMNLYYSSHPMEYEQMR
jgi:hypothetical protein